MLTLIVFPSFLFLRNHVQFAASLATNQVDDTVMVTIRLAREGAKKRPFYLIVVTDSRSPRDSRYIERVGHFNPLAGGKENTVTLNQERLDYWLKCGAQTSDRVAYLIKQSRKSAAASAAVPA